MAKDDDFTMPFFKSRSFLSGQIEYEFSRKKRAVFSPIRKKKRCEQHKENGALLKHKDVSDTCLCYALL